MRDIGILIWVAFIIIGVIGSMVSSLRKAAAARPQAVPPQWRPQQPIPAPRDARLPDWAQQVMAAMPQPQPQPQRRPQPSPASPPPAARPAPRAAPAAPEHEAPHQPHRRRFFGGKNDIVRAVIAAEVLGKPRGLNDEYVGR
jgi:hypothetical protein